MSSVSGINKKNVEDILKLGPSQEGILFHSLSDPTGQQYFEQLSLNLSGSVDSTTFQKAWNAVLAANEMLRTVFSWKKLDQPVQIVLKEQEAWIRECDLSRYTGAGLLQELEQIKAHDRNTPFDLARGPLFRLHLCKLTSDRYELIISNHHIIYDGWSTGVILKDFFQAYADLRENRKPVLAKKGRFKDYIKWLSTTDQAHHKTFWSKYLQDFDTRTSLPYDVKGRPTATSIQKFTSVLADELQQKVEDVLKTEKITVSTFFYTVWGILLHKYNYIEDIVVGTTVAGRPVDLVDVENVVGLFINTIPLRVQASGTESVKSLLHRIQDDLQTRQAYESTPLPLIKGWSELRGEDSLFDSIVVVENYPLTQNLESARTGLMLNSYTMTEMTNYPLALEVNTFGTLEIIFSYDSAVFDAESIEQLASHFLNLAREMAQKVDLPIRELEMLSNNERQQVLAEFGCGQSPRVQETQQIGEPLEVVHTAPVALTNLDTVLTRFETLAEQQPTLPAVSAGSSSLTYGELNAKAERLAAYLHEKGLQPEEIVGLLVERSVEMVIGIIAIMKAGGAYLPINPDYPEERITYMLEDSHCRFLLTQTHLTDLVPFAGAIVDLRQPESWGCPNEDGKTPSDGSKADGNIVTEIAYTAQYGNTSNDVVRAQSGTASQDTIIGQGGTASMPAPTVQCGTISQDTTIAQSGTASMPAPTAQSGAAKHSTSAALAYVIYTSGSTGKPKGVLIEHRALVNFLDAIYTNFNQQVGPGDSCLSLTNISFDVSVCEIFLPLVYGARLVLLEDAGSLDVFALTQTLINEAITFAYIPPTLLHDVHNLLQEKIAQGAEVHLNKMLVGVEPIQDTTLEEYLQLLPALQILNGYGPTEATICATLYRYTSQKPEGKKIPIGQPLRNTQVYILDPHGQPAPVGVDGELCIAGAGLARGYLNLPELTVGKFVPNPFIAGTRMYRTGDKARWLPNGQLEFRGRTDYQVKIRGFRIELGEIESRLRQHPEIAEVVVQAKKDAVGQSYLVTYYGASREIPLKDLRDFIQMNLPDYMVPSYFIKLDRLPVTASGKIDRRALPEVDVAQSRRDDYEPPVDAIEAKLAKIWEKLLNVHQVSRHDNFFDLGGHSLKATSLATRIHREFHLEVPVQQVFATPTVATLAEYVRSAQQKEFTSIAPVEERVYYPVSSAQKRMYIMNRLDPENTTYNISGALRIEGELDYQRLTRVFQTLVERHEALRTSFELVDGEPQQMIHVDIALPVEWIEDAPRIDSQPQDSLAAEQSQASAPIRPVTPGEFQVAQMEELLAVGDSTTGNIAQYMSAFSKPFDLTQAPLCRIGLVKLPQQSTSHLLMIDMHHIIADGVSTGILMDELVQLYGGGELPKPTVRYRDYAVWQNAYLQAPGIQKKEAFWLAEFAEAVPVLDLPVDFPRTVAGLGEGAELRFAIPPAIAHGLRELATEEGVTLYMLLLAAYNVLLSRYTPEEDIVVGSPGAGRTHAELEGVIGMFVNTLAIRNRPQGNKCFRSFLQEVRTKALQVYENQDYPFELLVERLQLDRDLERNPLFDTVLVLQNTLRPWIEKDGIRFVPEFLPGTRAKFDLTLSFLEVGDDLQLSIEYRSRLFTAKTITRLYQHLLNLCEEMIARPDAELRDLQMLSMAEREQILNDFNRTKVDYPRALTIHQLFEAQVARNPEKLAVCNATGSLTYSELNHYANILARRLRDLGVQPEETVGISAEHALEVITGVLAIVKAGGAYLPIDFDYPEERIRFMLEDSETRIILLPGDHTSITTGRSNRVTLANPHPAGQRAEQLSKLQTFTGLLLSVALESDPQSNNAQLLIETLSTQHGTQVHDDNAGNRETTHLTDTNTGLPDDEANTDTSSGTIAKATNRLRSNSSGEQHDTNLPNVSKPGDLIYVIYTSGSTGKPKGVMVTHQNVNRLISNSNMLIVSADDRIMQFAPVSFDASTFEIWGSLLNGATLYQIEKETILAPMELEAKMREYGITQAFVTSALFNQLVDKNTAIFANMQTLYVGGDAVSPRHLAILQKHYPELIFINGYGPTECTTFATFYKVEEEWHESQNLPIGIPHSNTTAYILDKYHNLCPVGVPGELCLGGDGLARGYLKRPELTAEKFIPNPLKPGELIYRTGDLCRWLPDGNIEFLGRIDNQVKIRGFRIEPGEIETCLLQHPAIKEVVVVVRTDASADKYLCAYFVATEALSTTDLRSYLSGQMPGYMIPSSFVQLEAMPLTQNGKIDRRALPDPEQGTNLGINYTAPMNPLEEQLVAIWAEILSVPRVGTQDNFFALGGHSLKATALVARVEKELEVELPLRQIFTTPTVKGLAQFIQGQKSRVYVEIEPVPASSHYPLSAAQKRMYILNQMDPDSTTYNIPAALSLDGVLDRERLQHALQKLVMRHESLRTSFVLINGEPVQIIHAFVEMNVQHQRVEDVHCQQAMANFVRPFDLQQAPLFRAELLELRDTQVLLLDMHHIISDGASMAIILDELKQLYAGEELAPLQIQYKDFAAWHNRYVQSPEVQAMGEYWLQQFTGEIPVLNLPTDFPRPPAKSGRGDVVRFAIDKRLTEALTTLALEEGTTLFMVLLGAYHILLAQYSNQEEIITGSPVAGRSHGDLDSIVGMFVNTLALRTSPVGTKRYQEYLQEVKEAVLRGQENGDYPFELLVERLPLERNLNRNPLFDAMFSLQNADLLDISLGDLKFTTVELAAKSARVDLSLIGTVTAEGLQFVLEYSTDLFAAETMTRLGEHFQQLLQGIATRPDQQIAQYDLLSEAERTKLVQTFNDTWHEYPRHSPVHQIFAEQADQTPDRVAVIYEEQALTYAMLNRKANQLARTLRQLGVEREEIVGIAVERSLEMIISLLAILKAGGAYMFIDRDYPENRIQWMLEDTGTRFILGDETLTDLVGFTGQVINPSDADLYRCDETELPQVNEPADLVCVIYTSGSTGKPKGVLIEHRNILRLVKGINYIHLTPEDRLLQTGSLAFDASSFEIWGSLLNGAALYLTQKENILAPEKLADKLRQWQITTLFLTTALCNQMTEASPVIFSGLRTVLFGGEKASAKHVNLLKTQLPTLELLNLYGPTEVTTFATYCRIQHTYATSVPIGTPVSNTYAYVMNRYGNLQPIGVPGELYLAGEGVARGYLNRPELTSEKFVDDPFRPGQRMYRTGDLVRWLPDGTLEFIERIDNQVKIRGFRIEPGEIEAQLKSHKLVKDALVLDRSDASGVKYLCGYVEVESRMVTTESEVAAGGDEYVLAGADADGTHGVAGLIESYQEACAIKEDADTLTSLSGASGIATNPAVTVVELKAYLAQTLPAYMIPAYFVLMDRFPLNVNGKVDRRALPGPLETAGRTSVYAPPATPTEEILVRLWEEILQVDSIGIDDNFFELGGHSLRATTLISRVFKELNVNLSLQQVFGTPTIRELARWIATQEESEYGSILAVEKQSHYPVSSAQRRLFILHQLEGINTSYNVTQVMLVEGSLDYTRLEFTLQKLIQRHEALRTSFTFIEGEPVQLVQEEVPFQVQFLSDPLHRTQEQSSATGRASVCLDHMHTLQSAPTEPVLDEATVQMMIDEFIQPFDLANAPLLRVGLIRLTNEQHVLVFDIHHIIADGTSTNILIRDFVALYEGRELESLRIQYKDFSSWQNDFLQTEKLKAEEAFWLETFAGEIPVLNLPADFPRPAVMTFAGGQYQFRIAPELTRQLEELAMANGATLYMLLLAAFNVLLARYSGQDDIVVGSPIAGRPHADLAPVVGMFVNTLAMRNQPSGSLTFRAFLGLVRERALQSYENQDYQFEMLVEALAIPRTMSRNPLFDVMLVLQNLQQAVLETASLRFTPYERETNTAKFDLLLAVSEENDRLAMGLEYSRSLFTPETVVRLAGHFEQILKVIVREPEVKLAEIDFMTEAEKEQLLQFNATRAAYPADATIHQLFEAQVEKTPDARALYFEGTSLTYSELNIRANQLARILRKHGIGPDQIVGVMLERSLEMVISILAAIKAGGAYLPVAPDLPEERIREILVDSGARVLLTSRASIANFAQDALPEIHLLLSDDFGAALANESGANLLHLNTPRDLLYLITTSGSTGKPKSVMLEHRNLVNLIAFELTQTNIDFTRVLQFATLSFDVSFQEIFSTLLAGGELYLVSKERRDNVFQLLEFIAGQQLTSVFMPVAYIKFIFGEEELRGKFPQTVRHIITAGEQLVVTEEFRRYLQENNIFLHNHYGPSETHAVTTLTLNPADNIPELPPIGKPIANTQIYIVNPEMGLQPVGVVGELLIAGDCVGRGYLHRPELTAEKYIENPFTPDVRMYRTGDLARWRPDGTLEFLGRADFQVKIRGFRVELGEIETHLMRHPAIKEAAVIDWTDETGNKYLCAYVVAAVGDQKVLHWAEVKEFLAKTLPEYMIPAYFVVMEHIPLNANGKVDRKRLPEPVRDEKRENYCPPTTELEVRLATLWSEILGVNQISVDDHFFELGGHSLKATALVARVFKEFQVDLPLRQIFKTPTLRELAQFLENAGTSIYAGIPVAPVREEYPLSSAQRRLFVLHQMEGVSTSYNMPGVMLLAGELDMERLERAFQRLIERHEALRTSFTFVAGEPVQRVHGTVPFALARLGYFEGDLSLDQAELEKRIRAFVQPFDLEQAPLLRVGLLEYPAGQIMIFDMHHIISDGTSVNILVREVAALYDGIELPPLRIQYKDFSTWQNDLFASGRIKAQEEFWQKTFADEIPVLNLPLDHQRPPVATFDGDLLNFRFDATLTAEIKQFIQEEEITLYMFLLAAYTLLLSKYAGQEDIIVGSPIAGRPHADLQNVMGVFINTLAMRNYPAAGKTFREFVQEVKERALQAYEHQDYPFEMLVETLDLKRDLSRNPLFDVLFLFQNTDQAEKQLSGLTITPYDYTGNVAKFDLTYSAAEEAGEIRCAIEYRTNLFEQATIQRLAGHLTNLVRAAVVAPEQRLGALSLLSAGEYAYLTRTLNDTALPFSQVKTIQQLVEEQVARTPDATALIYADTVMTYREWNKRAGELAGTLQAKGVGPEQIVGIAVHRSLDLMVSLLAILKAGGAYLPIDPEYPEERITYMLTDSGARLLITESALVDKVNFSGEILIVGADGTGAPMERNVPTHPENLAYVIYTSGSTGRPKGVMLEHRSVYNFIEAMQQIFAFKPGMTLLSLTTISFDIFVLETWAALAQGVTVVLGTEAEQLTPELLNAALSKHRVDILQATPSRLQLFLSDSNDLTGLAGLQMLLVGGEAFPEALFARLQKMTRTRIYNMYGPTETTVWSSVKDLTDTSEITLGRPVVNTRAYILDTNLQPVPVNVPGELYLAGAGLARGYLNRPDLTAERFLPDPFQPGERMYKTGDLASWDTAGEIRYLGRVDQQLKIRGFRIEPGEIIASLLTYPGIEEAAIVVGNDANGSYLIAYLVSDSEPAPAKLREYLAERLPYYMIPAYFIQIEQMPLTPNGKLDLKALPKLDAAQMTKEQILPRNEIEARLARLWAEALGRAEDTIGIRDSFFDLGGNSISLLKLHKLLNAEFASELVVTDLFKYNTIEELAATFDNEEEDDDESVKITF